MNDLELVRQLHRELVSDYQLARNYCLDVPTYALVHLRSVAHRLVEHIGALKSVEFRSKNLYDRIDQLGKMRLLDMRLARKLHKLRNDGNKGAHPEKYQLSQQQLVELAKKSVHDCAKLCAEFFPMLHDKPAPEWQFDAVDEVAGRELCYRAIMEDDAEAQYLVGISLKVRAAVRREQQQSFAEANESAVELDNQDDLAQAAYWFERAALDNPAARFEHGVALLHGYSGETDEALALELIQAAADDNNADAQALIGYFHLTGSRDYPFDPHAALRYLAAAAEQEQPEALANLAVLHYQGLLGAPDFQQARRYAEQGAQAGYPHAQYQLAVMLFAGEGGTVDQLTGMQWLQYAADQCYPEALADLAQRRLDGDGIEADAAMAESLYQQAIEYGALPRAMFELALAHFDGELPKPDLNIAGQLLWQAYRQAAPQSELALAIYEHSPELVQHLDRAIAAGADELAQVRAQFDAAGLPRLAT